MTVVGVRFKPNEKMYYFDPSGLHVQEGQSVIVQTARGLEFGEAVQGNTMVAENAVVQPLKAVVRIATEKDQEILDSNRKLEADAYVLCKDKIEVHELDMNLVSVECTFDRNKMLFYFTAEQRIDFRALVKDLASVYRMRIELRQIGVRDEAKMVGGLGVCGREICCSLYLRDFHPVSINMAKDQNLSLNPTKISGVCGRLMCCLQYEHEAYKELKKQTPRNGTIVDTPEGRGKVVSSQILRGTCCVQLEDSPDRTISQFRCGECCAVKRGEGGGCCQSRRENADAQTGLPTLEEAVETERFPNTKPAQKKQTAPKPTSVERSDQAEDTPAPKKRRRRPRKSGDRPNPTPNGKQNTPPKE